MSGAAMILSTKAISLLALVNIIMISLAHIAVAAQHTTHPVPLQGHRHRLKKHTRPGMYVPHQQQPAVAARQAQVTAPPSPLLSGSQVAQLAVQAAAASPAASSAAARLFSKVPAWLSTAAAATTGSSNAPASQLANRPECGPLTVEKVATAAVDFTVMLMVSDYSTTPDLLHHWLGNVVAANISYYLIAATDDATSAHLASSGLAGRCYRLAGTYDRGESQGYEWASENWKAATWRKVPAVQELLTLGYNVILSDIDVMWLVDPLPFLLNISQADFLISLDAHYSAKAAGDSGLEPGFSLGRLMNTGVYFARARIQVLNMFQQWLSMRRAHNHDQEGFKSLAATAGPISPVPGDERLGKVFGGTVVMGHLPLSSFLHSYSYSVMQLHSLMGTTAYEVHLVFGYGQQASKVYKLRDAGLGHDPADSEYYDPPRGLLSFDLVPPHVPGGFSGWVTEDLSYTEDDMEVTHVRAIDFQLQQLYHAMGLALALNRTLLMPEMLCFCAKGWFPNEACRLVGDKLSTLPFRCTGDQVFNIEALVQPNTSMAVAGAMLRVRPPGFATDARLPQSLVQGRLTVTLGQPNCVPKVRHSIWRHMLADDVAGAATAATVAAGPACVEEQGLPDGQKQLVVPVGHPGETMSRLLSMYSSTRWLHFTNVTAAFSGFKLRSSQEAYVKLLQMLVAEWCCRSADRVAKAGVADGHLHQIRPWGSSQRMCARRVGKGDPWDKVHSYFC